MKKVWICHWEVVPGDGMHREEFPSESAAKKAMAQRFSEYFDLSSHLDALAQGREKHSLDAAAFLKQFLTDLTLPASNDQIPPHVDIPDDQSLVLATDTLLWEHTQGMQPRLAVRDTLWADGMEEYVVDFDYENPPQIIPGRPNAMYIQITPHTDYGKSAYPLMILQVLSDTPKTQEQIIQDVYRVYETKIDRKAVRRHLALLEALNFPVRRNKNGFYME